ncbi:hypothetical protein SAMN02746011_00207 [Globicatella sulfidifaciens DSM 15739]|uniref:Uncharacterized protein n=1 Tax=Globicatella sulfidifaciens DSM 15739 TaxID=1121925 RepID=A0A1T4JMT6_9LACT|nr:hypothetical protein SAMN02746011_00207 [Globicatella sulfidifaciens DSM 15739]
MCEWLHISCPRIMRLIFELVLDAVKEMEKVEGCYIYSVGIATEDHSKVYIYEV